MIRIIYVSAKKDHSSKTVDYFNIAQNAAYEAFEETKVMTVDEWNESGILFADPKEFPPLMQAKLKGKLPCVVVDRGKTPPVIMTGIASKAAFKKAFIAIFKDVIQEQKGNKSKDKGDGQTNGKENGKAGKSGDNGNAEYGTSTWGGFGSISKTCWMYIAAAGLGTYIALTSKEQGIQMIGGAGAAFCAYKAYENHPA